MANTSASDVVLVVALELVMAGIATGVAGVSDEVGTMMVVFMAGLFLVWLIGHPGILQIPSQVFSYSRQRGAIS